MGGAEKDRESWNELSSNGARRPSFNQKAKRHCQRFWWLHLIIFAAFVLLVTLPVVYVAYPRIARHAIKHSHLNITSQKNTEPAPDSLNVDLTAVLHTHSSFHPTLKPFNASVYMPDSDLALYSFESPKTTAKNGAVEHIDQRVTLYHPDEFTKFTTQLYINETVRVYLKGDGHLKEGGLPTISVNWDQEIWMKGLNGLANLTVTNFTLLETAYDNGTNALGTIAIFNPSVLTIQIGDLAADNYVNDTFIGNSTVPDLLLVPGNHTYPIYFTSNETAVAGLIMAKYRCGNLPVNIATTSAVYNGTDIPYLTKSMQAKNLTTTVSVGPALRERGLGAILGSDC